MVTQMKTFAMALDLVDESSSIKEYREYHRNVWPEVKEGLLEIGVEGMEIYLLGDRLFMVIDTKDDFDLIADFQKYTDSSDKAAQWDTLMRKYQKKTPFTNDGDWWAPMQKVFDLNPK